MNGNQLFSELNLEEIETKTINEKTNCDKGCKNCCNWLGFLGFWIFIIIYMKFQSTIYIVLACIFYFLYLVTELSSPICISNQKINEIIEKLIKGKPRVYLQCECYHFVKSNERDSSSSEFVKVVTHSETINYNHISYRDISGLLILNTNESDIKKKNYIKLEIIKKVYLSDNDSISHFYSLKNNIIENNRHRDSEFICYNYFDIEGLPNSYLIKLKDDNSCVGFWYFILTLFTFGEIYKIYIECLTLHQIFTIRKLISISYDVNMDRRFNRFNPSLLIKHTNQLFQYNELNLLNEQINKINNDNINNNNVVHNENRNNQQNNNNQEQEDKNKSLSTKADEGDN